MLKLLVASMIPRSKVKWSMKVYVDGWRLGMMARLLELFIREQEFSSSKMSICSKFVEFEPYRCKVGKDHGGSNIEPWWWYGFLGATCNGGSLSVKMEFMIHHTMHVVDILRLRQRLLATVLRSKWVWEKTMVDVDHSGFWQCEFFHSHHSIFLSIDHFLHFNFSALKFTYFLK